VVCEQPNHPQGVFRPGYGRRPLVRSREDGTAVERLWVATSPERTTARRLAFYGSFAAGAGAAGRALARPHDAAFRSPPPPPAPAARPCVPAARDLGPAAPEALGEPSNPRLLAAAGLAERWLYRHAAAVTATTGPFCRHIDDAAGRRVAIHLPNGALDALLEA